MFDNDCLEKEIQTNLDLFCEKWIGWSISNGLLNGDVIKNISIKNRKNVLSNDIFVCDFHAFYLAYSSSKSDDLGKIAFNCYYIDRMRPIKMAASRLGISRQHFYARLGKFRQDTFLAAKSISMANERIINSGK